MHLYKLDVDENKIAGNPAGTVHWTDAIEVKVQNLIDLWEEETEIIPWYKFWKKQSISRVTNFLMSSVDEFIILVDGIILEGMDKKATVLAALDKLYDHVGREAVPVLLRPFANTIKQYIIYTLVAAAIDFFVDKYRNGEWREKVRDTIDEIKDDLNGNEEENQGSEEETGS